MALIYSFSVNAIHRIGYRTIAYLTTVGCERVFPCDFLSYLSVALHIQGSRWLELSLSIKLLALV